MWNFKQIAVCVVGAWMCASTFAQAALGIVISPAAPSSADSITMRIDWGSPPLYDADSYRVSQTNNTLRVTLGSTHPLLIDPPPFVPGFQFTNIDLGRLPAGNYLVDILARGANNQADSLIAIGIGLTVSDARTLKTVPYVQLNYADHWWNPAEPGWGLFIWHDKLDRLLGAWFTYGSDNKAEWYTIQAGSWVALGRDRYDGQLIKTSGPSFAAFVPGSAVQVQVVGTASLNFTDANNGTFTYTLNGVMQTKTISRFKP